MPDESKSTSLPRILVVDDEAAIQRFLRTALDTGEFSLHEAENGHAALAAAVAARPDIILLDLGLPDMDGIEVIRRIREWSQVPIIVLSVREREDEKVKALDAGADDYLTKPFELLELLARIEALLRRRATQPVGKADALQFGPIRVDLRGTTVTRDGKVVPLSAREFRLLSYFVQNLGTTLSREVLLKEVWGYSEDTFTRTVDVHVGSLRQKLELDSKQPKLIVTVPGLGYKFVS